MQRWLKAWVTAAGERTASLFSTIRCTVGHDKVVVAALIVLLIVTVAAAFAPSLAPYDPLKICLSERLEPGFWAYGTHGTAHLLGTDALGRDVLSRIIYGSRPSLVVALVSVGLGGTVGVALGLIAGYTGGFIDNFIMWLVDVFLAFPSMLATIAVAAVLGPGLGNVIIVLTIISWVPYTRIVRAQTLAVREREFVLAATAIGQRDGWILLRHILPNILAPVIVVATYSIPTMIITEAGLSFLGFGIEATRPTWGNMLAQGRDYIGVASWLVVLPGVVLTSVVLSVNVLGDWFRDVLDPKLRGQGVR